MVIINGGPGDSAKGWQGDGVDVEIEQVPTPAGDQYAWVLYDRAVQINSGVCRTAWRALWRSAFAAWRYRTFNRRW